MSIERKVTVVYAGDASGIETASKKAATASRTVADQLAKTEKALAVTTAALVEAKKAETEWGTKVTNSAARIGGLTADVSELAANRGQLTAKTEKLTATTGALTEQENLHRAALAGLTEQQDQLGIQSGQVAQKLFDQSIKVAELRAQYDNAATMGTEFGRKVADALLPALSKELAVEAQLKEQNKALAAAHLAKADAIEIETGLIAQLTAARQADATSLETTRELLEQTTTAEALLTEKKQGAIAAHQKLVEEYQQATTTVTELNQLLESQAAAVESLQNRWDNFARALATDSQSLTIIGATLTAIGVAAEKAIKSVATAAIDFDAAMAGVRKTTNSGDVEFAHLNDSVRELAATMPIAHTELAQTMMMAGQLGVRGSAELVKFTKTAAMLGTATSMSADEAAQNLAQLMRIMGDQFTMVENYGNVVVALGNTTAATETQILNVAKRIGGAASVVGMTADQVLAISAAVLDVGINVEVGGTAISRVLIEISNAISQGGKELDVWANVWAKTTHKSAADFRDAWANDVAGTFQAVIAGFADMKDNGEDLFGVIGDLGVDGIRTISVLTQLAGAADNMGDKFNLAAQEMSNGSALLKEYGLFAQTTANKIVVAKNAITDLKIELGQNLAPAIEFVADQIAAFASLAAGLPEWLQTTALWTVAAAGAVTMLGGGFLALAAQAAKGAAALEAAGLVGATAGARLARLPFTLGKVATGLAGLALELVAIQKIGNHFFNVENNIADINQLKLAFNNFAESGLRTTTAIKDDVDSLFSYQVKSLSGGGPLGALVTGDLARVTEGLQVTETTINGIAEAAYRAEQVTGKWWMSFAKFAGVVDPVAELETRLAGVQSYLVSMVQDGQAEEAALAYLAIVKELRAGGRPVEQIAQDFAEFTAALELHNREQLVAAANAATLADVTASIKDVYEAFTEAQNEAHSGLTDLGAGFEAAVRIVQKYPTALDELVAKFGDFAGSIATQITEVSNLSNAWEWARTELESPPDPQAWLDAIDQQIAAGAYFQQNTVAAYQYVADQIPQELQGVGADIVAALTPEQLDMFVNAFTPQQRQEFIQKSAQLGQFSGTEFATQMGESIMLNLPVISIEPEADTDLFVAQVQAAADTANITVTPTITTPTITSSAVDGSPLVLSPFNYNGPGRAAGGAITGGVPGKDSVPALLMPGEHVLTVADVNALGGQAGVYRLREQLGTPVQRFAVGGAVNPWPQGSMNNPTPNSGFWPWPTPTTAPAAVTSDLQNFKKALADKQKAEQKALDDKVKAEKKAIDARLKAEKKAIDEVYKAQVKAINAAHKAKLKEISKAKKAELAAINEAEKAAQKIVDAHQKAADDAYRAWEQTQDRIAGVFSNAAKAASNGTAAWQYAWDQQRLIAEGAARAAATLGLAWDDAFQPPNMGDWIKAMAEQKQAFTTFTGLAGKAMRQVKKELPKDMAAAGEAMLEELVAIGPESQDALKVFTQASAAQRAELITAWMGTGSWLGDTFGTEIAAKTTVVQDAYTQYETALEESLATQAWFVAQGFDAQREKVEDTYDQITTAAEESRDRQIDAATVVRDELIDKANEGADAAKDALGGLANYAATNPVKTSVQVDTSQIVAANSALTALESRTSVAVAAANRAITYNPWPVGSMNNPTPKPTYAKGAAGTFYTSMVAKADGGLIPGTPPANLAEDNVLMWAQSGEFVQQKRAVDYYGLNLMTALNNRKIPANLLRNIAGYADGGAVSHQTGTTIPAQPIHYPIPAGNTSPSGVTHNWNFDIKNPQAESPSVTTNKVLAGLAVEY